LPSGSFRATWPAGLCRQRPFAASGSSRWLGLVSASLTRLCFQPPNVKFRGTADSRPRHWSTSGIGVRRHSPAKSERQQTVLSRHQTCGRPVCSVRSRSTLAGVLTVSAIKPTFGSATSAGTSGSYTRYSRPRVATGRSRCADDCFPAVRTGGTGERLSAAAQDWPSAQTLPRQISALRFRSRWLPIRLLPLAANPRARRRHARVRSSCQKADSTFRSELSLSPFSQFGMPRKDRDSRACPQPASAWAPRGSLHASANRGGTRAVPARRCRHQSQP